MVGEVAHWNRDAIARHFHSVEGKFDAECLKGVAAENHIVTTIGSEEATIEIGKTLVATKFWKNDATKIKLLIRLETSGESGSRERIDSSTGNPGWECRPIEPRRGRTGIEEDTQRAVEWDGLDGFGDDKGKGNRVGCGVGSGGEGF